MRIGSSQLEVQSEHVGNVSANGKNFVSDKDNKNYKVDNPDALKGHEGQHVAIIAHVDPDTGDLHIMQVEVPDQQLEFTCGTDPRR
jgi:hypothetical protein